MIPEEFQKNAPPVYDQSHFAFNQPRFVPFTQVPPRISENDLLEMINTYISNPSNFWLREKLMNYGPSYPDMMIYQIISSGETSLMSWSLYKDSAFYSEEHIQNALFSLFTYKFSFKRILKVFKFNKELILNENAPFPKLVFIAFQKVAFNLFDMIVTNLNYSSQAARLEKIALLFQLFEKIFNYGSEVDIFIYDEFKWFIVSLIRNYPNIIPSMDPKLQLKMIIPIIYWDDAENLSLAVSIIPDIVFRIQKGNTLLHYAAKWSSVQCLRSLLDLVHEGALLETADCVSAFAYAIGLQVEPVLEAYADHGFSGSTIIVVNTMQILAKDFALQMGYMKSFNFYLRKERDYLSDV